MNTELSDEQRALARLLREKLKDSDDEGLDSFLSGYALGRIAGLLISMMPDHARIAWLREQIRVYKVGRS